MSNQDYYQKYIKYKQKYLSAKMIQTGGGNNFKLKMDDFIKKINSNYGILISVDGKKIGRAHV